MGKVIREFERTDLLFVISFFFLTLLQFTILCTTSLGLSPDEAYYWQWSKHLDYGYYSKGPIVAYLIAASTSFLGDTEVAVRLPALICYSLFSLLFYLFARNICSARTAFLTWILLRFTLIFAQMGFLMTADPPLLLFWTMALWWSYQAIIVKQERAWVGVGIATGLGMLAKYTAGLLYGSIVFFILQSKQLRAELRRKYVLASFCILCLFVSPLIVWDAKHGWVNIAHNAGHVASGSNFALGGFSLKPFRFIELLAGQFALVGPVVFIAVIWGFARGYRRFQERDWISGLLFFSSVPLGILCLLLSLTRAVYANWPLPVYVGGLLLLVHLYHLGELTKSPFSTFVKKYFLPTFLFQFLLTFLAHLPLFGITLGLPASLLPTKKLVGWEGLGERVEQELTQLHTVSPSNGEKDIVITDSYGSASEIAFYAKSHPRVYCANIGGRRMNQYDIWNGWEDLRGKNALIVLTRFQVPSELSQKFKRVEPIREPYEVRAAELSYLRFFNVVLREHFLFRAYGYDGSGQGVPVGR